MFFVYSLFQKLLSFSLLWVFSYSALKIISMSEKKIGSVKTWFSFPWTFQKCIWTASGKKFLQVYNSIFIIPQSKIFLKYKTLKWEVFTYMASYFLFCMKQGHEMVFMFVVSLRLMHCFYAVKKNINKYIEKQILWRFDFFEQILQKRNVWFQNIARINCEFLLKKREIWN